MSGSPDAGTPDLVEVRLLRFPLAVFQQARQHNDELLREFALLSFGRSEPGDAPATASAGVPARLVALVAELNGTYGGAAADVNAERDAAIAAGRSEIDLTYRVPASVAAATRHLGELLDEADAYCREGQHLLTLETPPEALRFRRWYLGQFQAQVAGEPPQPWPDYLAADSAPKTAAPS
jgi:hypothetical protein